MSEATTTEIATVGAIPLGITTFSAGDDDFFNESESGGYRDQVKIEQKGKRGVIEAGSWSTGKDDNIVDHGDEIDVLVLARRAKAVDMRDSEEIVVNYDPKSEEFQEIHAVAKQPGLNNCMSGPDFLLYHRQSGKFVEFFCVNKSSQRESAKLAAYMPTVKDGETTPPVPCTIKSTFVETSKYSWYAPTVGRCSTPFTDLPTADAFEAAINDFLNPKTEEVVEEDATEGRAV